MHFQRRSTWHNRDDPAGMPSLWTHRGLLHRQEAGLGPAELEDAMLQGSQRCLPDRARVPKVSACQQMGGST